MIVSEMFMDHTREKSNHSTLMEAFLKSLLLLLCTILCGASSQNCNQCQGCCFITANSTALCKCDKDCQEFGDCCSNNSSVNLSLTSANFSLEDGVNLECHSVIVNPDIEVTAEGEAFLMVSSCPDSWLDPKNSDIESNCSTPTQSLPPVTDMATGQVYRNEYCAVCNDISQHVVWPSRLVCNMRLYEFRTTAALFESVRNNPDIVNKCSSCSFIPPNTNDTKFLPPRSCIPRVETCLSHSELEIRSNISIDDRKYVNLVRECVSGSLDLVQSVISSVIYCNMACAKCNGDNNSVCFELQTRDVCGPPPCGELQPCFPSFTFTITLSNLGGGKIAVSSGDTRVVVTRCKSGEIRIGVECRPLICPRGYALSGGRCVEEITHLEYPILNITLLTVSNALNFTAMNCSSQILVLDNESYIELGNDTIMIKSTELMAEVLGYDDLGHPIICLPNNTDMASYMNCSSALVALTESDYTILDNSSVLFRDMVVVVKFRDKYNRPLVCADLINSSLSSNVDGLLAPQPGIQQITYIGCSLSVLGTLAVLLTYTVFSELQTFPGLVLMNLCVSILTTSLIFIIGGPLLQYHPIQGICSTLAIVLHYFYLSQFSWMSIFSFEITKTFNQARKLIQDTKQTKCKYFILYLFVGWIIPLIISAITNILNFTTGLVLYGVNSQGEIAGCWINHYLSFIIVFVLPLVLSLSCNLLLFVITTVLLCKAYKDQAKVEKSNIATMIRVWMAIFVITGLTWIFGFLAIFHNAGWMWYLFVIFNSTQGFSIFLTFIFTKTVFGYYKTLIKRKFKKELFFSRNIRSTMARSTMASTKGITRNRNRSAQEE